MDMPNIDDALDLAAAEDELQEKILDAAQRGDRISLNRYDNLPGLLRKAHERVKGLAGVIHQCNVRIAEIQCSTSPKGEP